MKLTNKMTSWLKPRKVTYLELYGYNGCRYLLTSPRRGKTFSVEINRPGAKGNAVLPGFTGDFTDAEHFTRYLVETGVRPEQLPHAAAAYYAVRS